MTHILDGHPPGTGQDDTPDAIILTAIVTKAADRHFELEVTQLPLLAIQVASLDEAAHAVLVAAARATGRRVEDFEVQLQW